MKPSRTWWIAKLQSVIQTIRVNLKAILCAFSFWKMLVKREWWRQILGCGAMASDLLCIKNRVLKSMCSKLWSRRVWKRTRQQTIHLSRPLTRPAIKNWSRWLHKMHPKERLEYQLASRTRAEIWEDGAKVQLLIYLRARLIRIPEKMKPRKSLSGRILIVHNIWIS